MDSANAAVATAAKVTHTHFTTYPILLFPIHPPPNTPPDPKSPYSISLSLPFSQSDWNLAQMKQIRAARFNTPAGTTVHPLYVCVI